MKNFRDDRAAAYAYAREQNAKKGEDEDKLYVMPFDDWWYAGSKQDLLALGNDEESLLNPAGFVYQLTWDRVTPESSEDRDTDGNGFVIQGERIQLDMNNPDTHAYELTTSEVFDTLEELVEEVREYGPWIEWSSSPPQPGNWAISQGHEDFRTGEVITYNLFVYQGGGVDLKLTEDQFIELKLLVKAYG